jgi:hypothetical protein
MIHKTVFMAIMSVSLAVNIAVYSIVEQMHTNVRQIKKELELQGEEFRNANGFDMNRVPCEVFEATEMGVRCKPKTEVGK